jgi:hypothetical protein
MGSRSALSTPFPNFQPLTTGLALSTSQEFLLPSNLRLQKTAEMHKIEECVQQAIFKCQYKTTMLS